MREIKFRALGSDRKRYYFTLSELARGATQTAEFCDTELAHFSQFTGRRDGRQNDIYEGDLVTADMSADDLWEVRWNENEDGFGLVQLSSGKWCAGDLRRFDGKQYWVVRGNIWEILNY